MTFARPRFVAIVFALFSTVGIAAATDPAPPAAWLSQVQRSIASAEYEVTWQTSTAIPGLDAAWQAPNRSQGLRTYFTPQGIRVVPRGDDAPSWEWGLAWVGYGRGGRSWPVPAASLAPSGARIDYQRGALSEWYENSPRGLKQGFVLAAPPDELGRKSDAEPQSLGTVAPGRGRRMASERLVHVDLALSGSLRPVISDDGLAIDFEAPGGARVVHYAELAVTDARGEPLAAWMEGYAGAGGGGIRIVIDDFGAVYPITVDPLATSPAWTAEGDQEAAYFGVAVATAGDVNGDGYADVIVGAHYYDNGQWNEGRAYVFLGSAAGLAATAAWTAESDQADAFFGRSVATAGDVNGDGYADVIVGANWYDNDQTDEGRAYVYLGSAAGLAATAAWTAESDQAFADFGRSVATAGDVNGDGYADVIVGADDYDNGQWNEGRAYVYLGSAAGLAASAAWTAESDQIGAYFGVPVATAGDVNGDGFADVIVGAPYYDNDQFDEGRAHVYLGSAAGLAATAAWTAESDQASAYFGISVATAGDVNGDGYADVIVGASSYDNGQPDEGRAYVYFGSAVGLAATAAWTAESDQATARFGNSVATGGDVNGDGYADVIVGAPYYDNGQPDEGRAYVYLGSAAGPSATAAWTAESDQASAYFGYSVATAGDVNGDGYADVIVGAYAYDNGQTEEGRAYLYLGSAAGLAATAAWTAESDQASAYFGNSVATAGDVNGDGYADVIVGAYAYDNGQTDEGRAYLYLGSAAGLAATTAWTAESDQPSAWFGYPVATAGDVNGDGYADVIVGARYYDNVQTEEGRAYVYFGSAVGLAATAAWTVESDQAYANFGNSVATAGDVNGDGYADVIVGAYAYDNGQTDEGRAYLYLGSAAGLAATAGWTAESDLESADFGHSVGTAGDVNGDGYADVIVGATALDNGQSNEGRAYVYLGSAAGLAATAAWTAESDQAEAKFGNSVATAGDVNGDGYADVIVSAMALDNGHTDEGRAYLYYGNGGPGLSLRPRQLRSDGSPIAHLGLSDRSDGFTLGIDARSPFGRARARLQWETKPLGTLFDGTGLGDSGAWVDTGPTGSTIEAPQAGLAFGTVYHWRARVVYDPVRSPFAQKSRWFTVPWNGWQEGDLRTGWESDFVVWQIDTPDPQFEGQPIDYHVIVTNLGPHASAATLIDSIPVNSTFQSVTTSQGSCGEALGIVSCAFGTVPSGASVDVHVTVAAPPGWSNPLNTAVVSVAPARDPNPANNTSLQSTQVAATNIGDFAWRDDDADGIHDTNEPGVSDVVVLLYDGVGGLIGSAETNANGYYALMQPVYGVMYNLRFVLPDGFVFSPRDRGGDDTLDSDADPLTGETIVFPLAEVTDTGRWDAGLIPDADGDGAFFPADCNEADPAVHPGAVELCNGWDDDCDGRVDETCDAVCDFPSELADETDLTPTATNAGGPRTAWTGTEYGMVVSDNHEGDYEIYFSRFDAAFGAIGSEVRVTNAIGSSASPYVAWTGTEYGVAWQDDRDGNYEIYFARLDAYGNRIGGDVRVTNHPAVSQRPRVEWSGISWGLLWTDTRDGLVQNYFVELDASGYPIGTERRITPVAFVNSSGRFSWNGSVYGVVYNTARAGVQHVGFQTLDRHGDPIVPETLVTSVTATVRTPAIAWDGISQFGISWIDNRGGADQLFFTRIAANGTKLTGDHPLVGLVSTASVPQTLVHSGSEWALAWIDQTVGNPEVYFARVAGDALANFPVRVSDNPATAQNPALEWNGTEYAIAFAENRAGASTYHVFGARIGCCTVSTLGDRVWRDADVDGIQDPGETGVAGVLVAVYNETGALLDAVSSGADGSYQISGVTCGAPYELRFFPPGNDYLSPANQGTDDALDSDPDPLTGSTGLFGLTSTAGSTGWDAGIAACWPPDEPVYIDSVGRTSDGNNYPILNFQDPNQPEQVSGYNVYRSDTPGAAWPWPLVATDVVDMDAATPNLQWVDTSGDVSPTGAWYYQVTAYNHSCPAEGPR